MHAWALLRRPFTVRHLLRARSQLSWLGPFCGTLLPPLNYGSNQAEVYQQTSLHLSGGLL